MKISYLFAKRKSSGQDRKIPASRNMSGKYY
jgi:hypothetical protein